MELWDNLVKNALVGTERLTPSLPTGDSGIDSLMGKLGGTEKERALLAAAGALACAQRAGYTPQLLDAVHLPKPLEAEDDLPRCREAATQDLATLLAGNYTEALPEWLRLVAEQGHRVPEEMLPRLLDYAKGMEGVRSAIGAVLGKRGHWLATQNKSWDFAAQRALLFGSEETLAEVSEEQTREIWETGTRAERTAVLTAVRKQDPTKGREMLEAVWSQEAYEERAAFLKTFEQGLSNADEPFLENTLDDRRKEVRTVAQDFLARLPDARYGKRMIERMTPIFRAGTDKSGKHTIEVTLPDAFDKAWARDGIDQKPPQYQKIGEKTFWLQQMVALTPLTFWETHFGLSPVEIMKANHDKDWKDMLRNSWTAAAYRQRNAMWAEILLHEWLEIGSLPGDTMVWREVLPKSVLEAAAIQALQDMGKKLKNSHPVYQLLSECGPVWSEELAHLVISTVLQSDRQHSYNAIYLLHQNLSNIPDSVLDNFGAYQERWESVMQNDTYYKNIFEKHLALRQFRREMVLKIKGS